MALSQLFLLTMFYMGYECSSKGSTYINDPTFENAMCPGDQIEFQKLTRSGISCVWKCDKTPGCKSLIYLQDNKTCFGIKSNNLFSTPSPLPGAVFYRPEIMGPGTPMVEGLPDSQFTASGFYGNNCEPWMARFNSTHSWAPSTQDTNQWLQVDFSQQILATHVATKGYQPDAYWVKSYKVLTSTDCINFSTIKDDMGSEKIFPGNTDHETPVENSLEPPVTCRCLRINPRSWHNNYIALRLEVRRHLL